MSQEALIYLTSWIKAQWRAGQVVGAISSNVKLAFPLAQGYPPQLSKLIHSFLSHRKTYLSYNGIDSSNLQLDHGLTQDSPLSPQLYLLYNNSLVHVADNHQFPTSPRFVDNVNLATADIDPHKLREKVLKLADI